MRRWPALLAVVLVVLTGYAVWPLLGLRALANAIETRDVTTFMALLDVQEVKRSLAAQIVRAHLKATGKDKRMSPLAIDLAVQAGIAVADSYMVEIIRAEPLMDLLREARADTFSTGAGSGGGALAIGWPNLRNARRLLAAEYSGRNFYVRVPLSAAEQNSFRIRMRLTQARWKLSGIELPEAVVMRLDREIRARGVAG